MTPEPRFFDLETTLTPPVVVDASRTALLVVDMQYHDASPDQGFGLAMERLDPGSMDYFNERVAKVVVPTIKTLLDGFRRHGARIIYLLLGSDYQDLRDMPEHRRRTLFEVQERSGVPDIFWTKSPAYAVLEEIAPEPEDTLVRKTTWGAFNGSDFEGVLRNMGIDTLVVTGITTNCCVETTVRDAVDRGFGCVVVDEGTADYDEAAHDASLRGLYFSFCSIVKDAAPVLAALDAGGGEL